MWKCSMCDCEFDAIPEEAVRLTHSNSRTIVFRFPDGSIHALRKIKRPKSENVPPMPESPKEATELLQSVVEVLAELPKPQPEIKPEPEIIEEVEEPVLTTMAAAFRNFIS